MYWPGERDGFLGRLHKSSGTYCRLQEESYESILVHIKKITISNLKVLSGFKQIEAANKSSIQSQCHFA